MIAAVLAVAAVALVAALFAGRAGETFRSIKIVETSGIVTINREGIGDLDAAVNMNLVSGDSVHTDRDAYVVLMLDADKYVMLGGSGAMEVIAEGDETSGRTSIVLEQGSVLSEIQNPLGSGSSYEVVTPNATMSVRGTVFEIDRKADGLVTLLVYDGTVAMELDGQEPILCNAGEYIQFEEGDPPRVLVDREPISEDVIDEQMRQRLEEIDASGRELRLGSGQIAENTLPAKETEETPEPESVPQPESVSEPTSAPEEPEETPEPVATQKPEKTPAPTAVPAPTAEPVPTPVPVPTAEPTSAPVSQQPVSQQSAPTAEPTAAPTAEPTAVPTAAPTAVPTPAPTAVPTPEPTAVPTPAPTPEPVPTPTPQPTSEPTPAPVPEPTPQPEPTPAPVQMCTVTFADPYVWVDGTLESLGDVYGKGGASVQKTVEAGKTMTAPDESEIVLVANDSSVRLRLAGWYLEHGEEWNFDTYIVNSDFTLYPVWEEVPADASEDDGSEESAQTRKYWPVIFRDVILNDDGTYADLCVCLPDGTSSMPVEGLNGETVAKWEKVSGGTDGTGSIWDALVDSVKGATILKKWDDA